MHADALKGGMSASNYQHYCTCMHAAVYDLQTDIYLGGGGGGGYAVKDPNDI